MTPSQRADALAEIDGLLSRAATIANRIAVESQDDQITGIADAIDELNETIGQINLDAQEFEATQRENVQA